MNKLSLSKLKHSKYFISASLIGGFVGIALLVFLIYRPLLSNIDQQRMKINELKINIASAEALKNMLPEQEAEFRRVQKLHTAFKERIGTEASMARVLETLNVAAKNRQLQLVAIQPRTNGDQPLFKFGSTLSARERPVNIRLTGRFRSIAEFLGMLPEASFLASVKQLTLEKSASGALRVETELLLIVYLGEGKELL